jgi:hypothetical protein
MSHRCHSPPLRSPRSASSYTLIALFPVFVIIINSFKGRATFSPLSLPSPGRTIGYVTVKRGDFPLYFQNSLIVTVVSLFFVLLFGAMAAFALSEYRFKGNTADGALPGARDHDPDPAGDGGDPADHGGVGDRQHARGADPRLHRAGAAALDLHPLGVHANGERRPEECRPDRRHFRIPHLLPAGAAAGAAGAWRRSRCSP